ncbi:MAG: response regulator, partial [Chitinophagaceae bacterium]
MKNILIVEDSDVVVKVLRHLMSQSHDYQPVHTTSFAQVKALLDHTNNPNSATSTSETQIFGALVDCQLSDAPNGEILDYLLSKKIPTILFAGADDLENCEQYFQKGIADYVMKEGRHAYKNAINIITRLEKNQGIKVMVVDESEKSRAHIVKLLSRHLFQVVEAKDGMDAIKILLDNPDIKLLFTDHDMRRMDDFELIRNLRHKYDQTELVIIGITSSDSRCSSAQYIKHGANDFLVKPFQPEEFYYRVNHNIELLESNERVAHASQRDHLTGLFHRQYFFNAARDVYTQSEEKSSPLA